MDYKKEIGRRIKKARQDRELTLDDLSKRTRDVLSLKRINAYENGDRMPGPAEAVTLAKALGVRPAYILAVDDIQIAISNVEESLIANWRRLPENERMSHFRQIEQLAMAYRDTAITNQAVERHFAPPPVSKAAADKKARAKS